MALIFLGEQIAPVQKELGEENGVYANLVGGFEVQGSTQAWVGFAERDQTYPDGRFRFLATSNTLLLQVPTTASPYLNGATDYSTVTTIATWTASGGFAIPDNVPFDIGTTSTFYYKSTSTLANTAVTGAVIGTPVSQALAADTIIWSNQIANGDFALYGNLGGNSIQFNFYDTSASRQYLWPNGVAGLDFTSAAMTFASAASTANQAVTIQNTSNAAAASHAYLDIAVGGTTSTGDPQLRLSVPSGTSWHIAVDNSDSDKLFIGTGTTVGSSFVAQATGSSFMIGTTMTDVAGIFQVQANGAGAQTFFGMHNLVAGGAAGTGLDFEFAARDDGETIKRNTVWRVDNAVAAAATYSTRHQFRVYRSNAEIVALTFDGTAANPIVSVAGSNVTIADGAAAERTVFAASASTSTLAGTTQVTSLMEYVAIAAHTINQSGGAVTVDKATGLSVVGPTAGTSVTITHASGVRILAGGAGVNVSGLFLEAQTAGTTSNPQIILANGGGAVAAIADLVQLYSIDTAAGDARFYFQSEAGSAVIIGNDILRFAASTGIIGIGATTAWSMTSTVITTALELDFTSNASLASATDLVKLGGFDLSAGNRTLALATETAVASDASLVSTNSLQVRINGATYKIPLVAV